MPAKRPWVIGITGGMASGKTTVARMLAGRAVLHVNADQLVHQLMAHDPATRDAIAQQFRGALTHGRIDRAVLAQEISTHPEKLALLEHILHPRVRAAEEGAILQARRNGIKAVLLDVPLLFETGLEALCDVVLVAHAPLFLRRRRAFLRPGMTDEKWNRLLDRQLPSHLRNRLGDHVIYTSLGKAVTRRMLQQLMKKWGLA